jgi:plasmid stabilization system protein ParE
MKIVYTDQSFESLNESLQFLLEIQKIPMEKVIEIRAQLLDKVDSLIKNPHLGQPEEYLEHLEKGHRRLVFGNFKIIYRVEGNYIYITDFFDSRQDPEKMKG